MLKAFELKEKSFLRNHAMYMNHDCKRDHSDATNEDICIHSPTS